MVVHLILCVKKSLLSAVLFDGLIKLESLRIVGRFSHYIDCSLGDIAVSCSDTSHKELSPIELSWTVRSPGGTNVCPQ